MSFNQCKYEDRYDGKNSCFSHQPTSYSAMTQPLGNNHQVRRKPTYSRSSSETTSTRPACRFGSRCHRHNCSYNHSYERLVDDRVNTSSTLPISSTENSSQMPPDTPEIKATYCELGTNCQKWQCFLKHPQGREIDRNPLLMEALKFIVQQENELFDKIEQVLVAAQQEQQQQEDMDDGKSNEGDEEQPVGSPQENSSEELILQKKEFQSATDHLREECSVLYKSNRGDQQNLFQLQRIDQQLQREYKRWQSHLPIYARRRDIIKKLRQNQVLILKADTGSGKSTQVVQYLCDEHFADSSKSTFCLKISLSIITFNSFRTNHFYTTT